LIAIDKTIPTKTPQQLHEFLLNKTMQGRYMGVISGNPYVYPQTLTSEAA
jgi:hypothetical protein